jgi:hypothetical protein
MKTIVSLLTFIAAISWNSYALAENDSSTEIRIPTVTRLVLLFTQLENNLSRAIAANDKENASKLLMNNFEMRSGTEPGDPIPKAEWLQEALKQQNSEGRIEQMSVHGYDNISVVSYLLKQTNAKPNSPPDVFIVDVWTLSQGTWKLSVRYADVPDSKRKVPGIPPKQILFEKRY